MMILNEINCIYFQFYNKFYLNEISFEENILVIK